MLVSSDQDLAAGCEGGAAEPHCVVDVEFVRRRTYWPIVGVIQLGFRGRAPLIIDALAVKDLTPLAAVLRQPRCLKVLHAAAQDIEALALVCGTVPDPIFDTQVAAAFCGLGYQVSLAGLAEACLQLRVSKKQQQSDWLRRPLSPAQIAYAEHDVEHLWLIYDLLAARLRALDRYEWVLSDCAARLAESRAPAATPAALALRVPGAGGFAPREFTILALLAAWRDEVARQHDRPPRWIVGDDVLRELAQQQPRTASDLARIPGLEPGTGRRFGSELVACVARGLGVADADLWHPPAGRPLTPAEKSALMALSQVVAATAAATGIAREVLATSRDLTSLVQRRVPVAEHPLLQGWRGELMGGRLTAAMAELA